MNLPILQQQGNSSNDSYFDDLSKTMIDLSKIENSLEHLCESIQKGETSEVRAMEVAMYSVNFIMSRFSAAQDVMRRFCEDKNANYKECEKECLDLIGEAKTHALILQNTFSKYPSISETAKRLHTMIYYHEAYIFIGDMFQIAADRLGQKEFKTYFFKNPITNLIKIGKSIDIHRRKKDIQVGTGAELEILYVSDKNIEGELHRKFKEYRVHGEWFDDKDGLIQQFIDEQLTSAGVA